MATLNNQMVPNRLPIIDLEFDRTSAKIPQKHVRFTLWLFNIAMENGPFIDGLPGFTY